MVFNKKLDVPKTWDLIRSIPNIRREWSLKSPYKKYCFYHGVGRLLCEYLQIPVFKEDQSLCWWTYFAFFYTFIHILLAMYTIYYYSVRAEYSKSLPCTCLLGPIFASLPFMCIAISKKWYFAHYGLYYSGRYIYPDKHDDKKYVDICSNHVDGMVKNVVFRIGIFMLCFITAEIGPIYIYLKDGSKTTFTEVRIPFTEEKSISEFIGNSIIQSFMAFHGFPGYIAMEIAMEIYFGCVMIAPKVIGHELRKLEDSIKSQQFNKFQSFQRFKYIIKLTMDNDNYIFGCADLMYWRCFVTPPAFTYGIGMSFFCQYMFGYPCGFGLALISYVQLYFMCVLGEVYEDNGVGETFWESQWYLFPIEVQKDLMYLIHKKQHGAGLSIGPFAKINMECFGKISNKIYSLIMFLVNFYE